MNYGDFQVELYVGGLSGVRPELPVTAAGMEDRARAAMSTETWSYVAGGAGNEFTQDLNVTALDRYGLVPPRAAGRGCSGAPPSGTCRRACSAWSCPRRCCWRRSA